jgi:P-type Ca2+ transporter type 2C
MNDTPSRQASDALRGLSSDAARQRLAQQGANELPRSRTRSFLTSAVHALAEPMFGLLVVAAAIYVALGDRVEAIFLAASVIVVMSITLYQEFKTERVLEALRDLASPRALVIRDGIERRIPGRDVVVDDVLVVGEGDRIAADGVLLVGDAVHVDESLLTGESVPVMKSPTRDAGADDASRVFAGTLVVRGQGIARVTATGANSEMGRIGRSLEPIDAQATALQVEMRRLVLAFSVLALIVCTLLVAVFVAARGGWLGAILAGVTLAMAILPEEFPVVLTVFLALGAWRMARVHVLARRMTAIEALGAATVLCVDKTGTLTQNRMTIRRIYANGRQFDPATTNDAIPAPFAAVVRIGVLASEPRPFDPMERAFHELVPGTDDEARELVRRYPLSSQRLIVTHAWRDRASSRLLIAAKGAPEAIIEACALPPDEAASVLHDASVMAASGMRVLGVARGEQASDSLPDDPRALHLDFVGLVGLVDPLRPSVPEAMRECRNAGVRVIVITGDFAATAHAIAREAGVSEDPRVVSGTELAALSDDELAVRLATTDVFARVVPAQKLRIVEALSRTGNVVAMTGDGVNDAPALKAAQIGIAMGARGTDVAREAADLVLLDDDFGSIVRAIRQGRTIFDNLRKALSYLVSVHVPIAGLGLVPVLVGGPLVLFPAHVVFLEFVIDPACSIAFEAEPAEPDVMRRPPRRAGTRLLGRRPFALAMLEGTIALAFCLLVYGIALLLGMPEERTRLLAFTAVIAANLSLILFARGGGRRAWRHVVAANRSLWAIVWTTLAIYGLIVAVTPVRHLFHLAEPAAEDALILGIAVVLLWFALGMLNVAYEVLGTKGRVPRATRH